MFNEIVEVNADSRKYNIYIEPSFENLGQVVKDAGLGGRKICVIADSNTAEIYLDSVKTALSETGCEFVEIVFPAGEQNKTLAVIEAFYARFLSEKLDRTSVVVALGGGVCGDMAGFAAATYMRGIKFIQIPTTLLAQVDSSVGGKTGVDFGKYKNVVGAFYQPEFVYINVKVLETLPSEQFASGMAEAIKHGLIRDSKYFNWMNENAKNINDLETIALMRLVSGSCKIKSEVVSQDERESGLRAILNFGHTFGHAVEGLCDYALPHGHCVSIGAAAAFELSSKVGLLTREQIDEAKNTFEIFGLPTKIPAELKKFTEDEVFTHMLSDKKTTGGKLNIVLLDGIGNAVIKRDMDECAVREAIEVLFND